MISGERVDVGAVVDLAHHAANMVIAANKARPATAPQPQPPACEPSSAAPRRRSTTTPD